MSAPSAQAATLSIATLRITPRVLPSSGGSFTITARVRGAVSCTIYTYGLASPRTVRCSSGRVSYRRRVPPDTRRQPERWTVQVEAHRGRRKAFAQSTVEVLPTAPAVPQVQPNAPAVPQVLPSATATPPVVNLDACTDGPECDYGAAYEHFENWGNIAPEALGDCTFAAAANWLQILFRWHVPPTLLGYEFAQAGGTAASGLPQNTLWRYWERSGIGGSYLTGLHSYYTTPENVRNGVRDYAAMIVQLRFGEGWHFAQYTVAAGLHDVVVMGFTPEGPLVVSWGAVVQMTWEQWADEAIEMWGIGATNPNT
jgi:hypothetical protein